MKPRCVAAVLLWFLGASALATGQDPPPIALEFYGYVRDAGGIPRQAFFRDANSIYIAAERDLVKDRYRVVRIELDSVIVEDTSSQHQQTLPLAVYRPNNGSAVVQKIPGAAPSAIVDRSIPASLHPKQARR